MNSHRPKYLDYKINGPISTPNYSYSLKNRIDARGNPNYFYETLNKIKKMTSFQMTHLGSLEMHPWELTNYRTISSIRQIWYKMVY